MIKLSNVTFKYKNDDETDKNVLNGISLEIREGEYISMMGRNGSGKSTFVRCLNGILLPTSGEICIDDLKTTNANDIQTIRRKVGIVFQNPDNQIVSTTVEREIAFGLENLGVPSDLMQQVVSATMERFRLTKYQKYPPHLLSGGEKQRLALAAVMAMNPKYLILDEPSSMLDPNTRKELLNILLEIKSDNKNKKTTNQISIISITQFPEETLDSDRLLIIDSGKIVFDDAPEIVFQNVDQLKQMGLEVPIEFEINPKLVAMGFDIEPLKGFR